MTETSPKRRRVIIAVAALTIVGFVAMVWTLVTSFAGERVREEAADRGVQLEFESIWVWPNGVAQMEQVDVKRGSIRAEIELLEVDVEVFDTGIFDGAPTVTAVEIQRAKVTETAESSTAPRKDADREGADVVDALKRFGGGVLPAVRITDLELTARGVEASVGDVELTPENVVVRSVTAGGPRLLELVTKPVTVEEAHITPTDAVLRRDRSAIESVEVVGLSVETETARLRRLLPSDRDDDEGERVAGDKVGWNERAHRLLNRGFFLASGVAERVGAAAPPRAELRESRIFLADRELEAKELEASWTRKTTTYSGSAEVVHRGKSRGRVGAEYSSPSSRGKFRMEGFDLAALKLMSEKSPLGGRIDGEVQLTKVDETFALKGRVASRDAFVDSKRLAEEPVVVSNLAYEFEGSYAPVADDLGVRELGGHPTGGVRFSKAERIGKFEMTHGKLTAPSLEADVRFGLYGLGSLPVWPARFDLDMSLPPTPAQAVFDVIPPQLLGELDGARLGGKVSGSVVVEIPLQRASRMRWQIDETLEDFEIVELPEAVDVRRLMGPMTIPIGKGDPCRMTVEIPPMRSATNPRGEPSTAPPIEAEGCAPWKYVPLDGISDYIHRGILTTEDRGFYHHTGFNTDEIRKSLERNIEDGRFARGASTISMQFVKNLFLSKDKRAARKLREAILVYFMEHVVKVPKKRIMEIYLNVIEYGVGVYGIWAAAQHYFAKTPAELTLIEVAWIITLIPGPRSRYPYFKRRKIPDEWWERIQGFLDEMHRQEKIDAVELRTAKSQPLKFRD